MGYFEADPDTGYSTAPKIGDFTQESILTEKDKTKTTLFESFILCICRYKHSFRILYLNNGWARKSILGLSDLMSNKKTYSDIFGNIL